MKINNELKNIVEHSHKINLIIQNFSNYSEVPALDIELSLKNIRELYEEILMFKLININQEEKSEKSIELEVKPKIELEIQQKTKEKPKNVEIENSTIEPLEKQEEIQIAPKSEKQVIEQKEPVKPEKEIEITEEEKYEKQEKENKKNQNPSTETDLSIDETAKMEVEISTENTILENENTQNQEINTSSAKSNKPKKTEKIEDKEPTLFDNEKFVIEKPSQTKTNFAKDEKQVIGDQLNKDVISINERLSQKQSNQDVSSLLKSKPIADIKKAISLNDKIWLINELFSGNADIYNQTIEQINDAEEYENAIKILDDNILNEENLKAKNKITEFIKRRFL